VAPLWWNPAVGFSQAPSPSGRLTSLRVSGYRRTGLDKIPPPDSTQGQPPGENQPAFPLPETWEDVLRLGVSVARVVIYEAIPSLFKADIYVRRGAVRRREMKAILIVLLLMGYFMSLGRVKRRNNRNTEERAGWLRVPFTMHLFLKS
jgi:hypothetical protein